MKNYILKIKIAALEAEYEKSKKFYADDEQSKRILENDKKCLALEIIKLRNELLQHYDQIEYSSK